MPQALIYHILKWSVKDTGSTNLPLVTHLKTQLHRNRLKLAEIRSPNPYLLLYHRCSWNMNTTIHLFSTQFESCDSARQLLINTQHPFPSSIFLKLSKQESNFRCFHGNWASLGWYILIFNKTISRSRIE